MNMMTWAIIGIGAFVAIWMLFVVPAERRHHERKLEMIQKRIEKRQAQTGPENSDSPDDSHDESEDS